jgi:hypothetical protein
VRNGGTPLSYLSSAQAPDGHYRYSSTSDQTPVWVTGQALMAVNGAAFPLNPAPRAVSNTNGGSAAVSGGTGAPAAGGGTGGQAQAKSQAPSGADAQTQTSDQADQVPLAPASSSDPGDGGGGGIPGWVIAAGLIVLGAGVLWGGWVLYRRRLPST